MAVLRTSGCVALLLVALSAVQAPATTLRATDGDGRLQFALREASGPLEGASAALHSEAPAPTPAIGGSVRDKLARVKYGWRSLLVPGWSQYASGNHGRAVFFASAEAAIWGTWIFSEMQGRYREDQYEEFAREFAGVRGGDRDEEYWRLVSRYRDSEAYNEEVRRENRVAIEEQESTGGPVTIGLNDGILGPEDAWAWTSIDRRVQFGKMRADALSAYDRADLVILFALVNRLVSFADAVRTGPGGTVDGSLGLVETAGFELSVRVDPNPLRPGGSLQLGRSF